MPRHAAPCGCWAVLRRNTVGMGGPRIKAWPVLFEGMGRAFSVE